MVFVRTVRTTSGAAAVQAVAKFRGGNRCWMMLGRCTPGSSWRSCSKRLGTGSMTRAGATEPGERSCLRLERP